MKASKVLFPFIISIFTVGIFSAELSAVELLAPPAPNQSQSQNVPLTPEMEKQQRDIDTSAKYAQQWFLVVDKGDYGTSYDMATRALQGTVSRNEWIQYLNTMKGSHGQVVRRQVVDIRTAKDPSGAPAGDYMVFVTQVNFASGQKGTEIITLQEDNNVWRVYSYTLSAQ